VPRPSSGEVGDEQPIPDVELGEFEQTRVPFVPGSWPKRPEGLRLSNVTDYDPAVECAVPTVKIDNDRARVTEWRFVPGAATGWHRHEHDYVIVPLATGNLRLEEGGNSRIAELTVGEPYFREAGVEHDVINANDHEFAFVEIEIKA
jgi:quercetin dioxygenase-like cupin family protein